jgi:hypothetical protein
MNKKGLILILRNSAICGLVRIIWERLKRYSAHSFLLSLPEKEFNAGLFKGSKIASRIIILYENGADKLIDYFKASGIARLSNKFYSSPVRSLSSLIISVTLISAPLSLISPRKFFSNDWIAIAAVLFIAINGLFCGANWEEVKKGSVVLNKIFRWPKIN